jgi:hypothetical protein
MSFQDIRYYKGKPLPPDWEYVVWATVLSVVVILLSLKEG